jgi:predicted Na+-dependent transporter
MVLLPTLIYHMAQLILSAPLATHLAGTEQLSELSSPT